ncbi:MAG: hypothetical protein NUV80_05560 [Candidatus Berkelbacteria bacterium]|nr:hypothetical protein [Candidatus Berkelbacteria bacterium]
MEEVFHGSTDREKLKIVNDCDIFARNAREHGREDLALATERRAIQLNAMQHGAESQAEKERLQAFYGYELIFTSKNNRNTRASRTGQMIKRHGILEAVARAANRLAETAGYSALCEMGLEVFAFEAVVVGYPDLISREAVERIKDRIESWNNEIG